MITKHSQTKYFVLKPGVAMPAAPTTTFYNASTDAININTGVGGFYNIVAGSGNHTLVTPPLNNAGRQIKFIQKRDKSGDRNPLYNYPLIESHWIDASCINGIQIQAVAAALPTNNLHLVGASNVATSGLIPILDEFTYKIQTSGHGDRTDWYNSVYNTPTTFGYYTTPDLSATTLTDIQKRDLIIESLIANYNTKTQSMSFGICIESDASAVVAANNEVLISSLGDGTIAIGTSVIIGYNCEGDAVRFIMDASYQETFRLLDVALTAAGFATAKLVPYLTPDTANLPAGVAVAGTTKTVDHFAVVSIDEGLGYHDYRMATKRRLTVGLAAGFDGTTKTEVVVASEGQGQAHQIAIAYNDVNGYEEVSRPKAYQAYHVAFPNEVLKDAMYDYFVIEHCSTRTASSGMPSMNNQTTIIAVVNTEVGDAISNPYFTGVANPQKTYIQGCINDFITNNNLGIAALAI